MAAELALGSMMGDGGSSGGGGDAITTAAATNSTTKSSFKAPYAHWSKIWPEQKGLPLSWADQRLDTLTEKGEGIKQTANGPCGVLSVVQAELWMQQQSQDKPFEERLSVAVSNILSRVISHHANHHKQQVIIMPDGSESSLEEASKQIRTAKDLVEAVVSSYGPDKLQLFFQQGNSLVEGPHWLCSSDLMCLLLRGYPGSSSSDGGGGGGGGFGAWNPTTSLKEAFYYSNSDNNNNDRRRRIGMLSYMEIEEGIKVADDLKFVKSNVWITHTGDHFTTMRLIDVVDVSSSETSAAPSGDGDDETSIIVEVYNGLPPAGPIFERFKLTGDLSMADPAEEKHVETFKKKRPGQPDDIVQARKTDSKNYKDWSFEVVPAVDDPTVSGPFDDDPNEPIYSFDTTTVDSIIDDDENESSSSRPWRCASCYYTRFKTMNFGINDSGGIKCNACGKNRNEAFWSLWFPYDELSPRMKRRARQMYATKMELVISTLWPKATIDLI